MVHHVREKNCSITKQEYMVHPVRVKKSIAKQEPMVHPKRAKLAKTGKNCRWLTWKEPNILNPKRQANRSFPFFCQTDNDAPITIFLQNENNELKLQIKPRLYIKQIV